MLNDAARDLISAGALAHLVTLNEELMHRLAQTYVGAGTRSPPMPDPPPGFLTRITVERVGGNGPWT